MQSVCNEFSRYDASEREGAGVDAEISEQNDITGPQAYMAGVDWVDRSAAAGIVKSIRFPFLVHASVPDFGTAAPGVVCTHRVQRYDRYWPHDYASGNWPTHQGWSMASFLFQPCLGVGLEFPRAHEPALGSTPMFTTPFLALACLQSGLVRLTM